MMNESDLSAAAADEDDAEPSLLDTGSLGRQQEWCNS